MTLRNIIKSLKVLKIAKIYYLAIIALRCLKYSENLLSNDNNFMENL